MEKRDISMAMPMMYVRVMRVAMADGQVAVRVAVRFAAIPVEVVLVLVVRIVWIVPVAVRVLGFFVCVRMLVSFSQVQPDADSHQSCGQPEQAAHRVMQH